MPKSLEIYQHLSLINVEQAYQEAVKTLSIEQRNSIPSPIFLGQIALPYFVVVNLNTYNIQTRFRRF